MRSMAEKYKSILRDAICDMGKVSYLFVKDPGRDFTRKRKLSFEDTLTFLICMGGLSLDRELRKYFCSAGAFMTRSAFIQRRDKILPDAMEVLFHEVNDRCDDPRTMCGYRVLAVDGSDINIARDETADSFIDSDSGFNQIHLNALYDLENQVYVDAVMQPRPKMDERKALIRMLERMPCSSKRLIIADRGYESYAMFETLNRMPDVDYVIRAKNSERRPFRDLPMAPFDIDMEFDIRTTQTKQDKEDYKAGRAVFIVGESKYKKEKKNVTWPYEPRCIVNVRAVRFQISEKNGAPVYETIVTSLPREWFPPERIKELYHIRWGVETSFRDLKYTVGLAHIHAKKEEAVKMEIFANLIAHNYAKRIALSVDVSQPDRGKYRYRVNFVMAFAICMDFLRCRDHSIRGPDVDADIRRYIEPVRPGRADKRKMKAKHFVPFIYRIA